VQQVARGGRFAPSDALACGRRARTAFALHEQESSLSVQTFAAAFRDHVVQIKGSGTAAIYCDALIEYFDGVSKETEQDPGPVDLETYKHQLQLHVERTKDASASRLEMFKSVIASGQNAIRTSFLMNGGASVALLAFIGHLAAVRPANVPLFADVLFPFVLGVLAMTMVSGFTYLSQWLYSESNRAQYVAGMTLNVLCILLGLGSYGCFIVGMGRAQEAFAAFV